MNRRQFIRGGMALAAIVALPSLPVGDGISLLSIPHPDFTEASLEEALLEIRGMAIARSVAFTREATAVRIYNNAFSVLVHPRKLD